MKASTLTLALLGIALVANFAHAHFIWVITTADSAGKLTPHLVFGEGPEPGEEYLLDKVAQAKVWIQLPGKEPQALRLTKQAGKEVGSWTSDVDAKGAAVFATCEYGVLEKNGKTFLLQYYAKKLDATPAQLKSLARTEKLPLDIVPALDEKNGQVTVLWQGKPAAECEVTVTGPDDKSEKVKTDASGVVKFTASAAGTHTFRAKLAVEKAGELGGKSYPSQTHYTTLVLNVAGAANAK